MNSENITLDEGQKWLREAIEALHSKNSGGSRTAALKAIEMGEDGAAVWGVLALACRDQGDFDMAQKAADRSIELEPRNVRAHIVKADAFLRREQRSGGSGILSTRFSDECTPAWYAGGAAF